MASIVFVGGAVHPRYNPEENEKQYRMVQSVRDDLETVLAFASQWSTKTSAMAKMSNPSAPDYQHKVPIKTILLNADITEETIAAIKDDLSKADTPNAAVRLDLLAGADIVSYVDKLTVRGTIAIYFEDDDNEHIMLFMSGHGDQQVTEPPVQESFLLPIAGSSDSERYTDADLAEDIRNFLPPDNLKKLYLIIHSCHSGGMLNTWTLDAGERWVILFASAEADILAQWNFQEAAKSFVQVFCTNAAMGRKLNQIAENILMEMQVPDMVRPAFIPSRPTLGDAQFLVSSSN